MTPRPARSQVCRQAIARRNDRRGSRCNGLEAVAAATLLAKCHCPDTLPGGRPTSPRGVEVVEMNGPQRLYSTVQKSKPVALAAFGERVRVAR